VIPVSHVPAGPSLDRRPARYRDVQTLYSVLQSSTRSGPWVPPEIMRVVSVLGSVVLDYREADLPPGVTELDCQVYLGNVEIVVPPDVDVELTGSVLLGNVATERGAEGPGSRRRLPPRPSGPEEGPEEESERPLLSVDCSGVMGNVAVRLI
jgi:hypothetical protein